MKETVKGRTKTGETISLKQIKPTENGKMRAIDYKQITSQQRQQALWQSGQRLVLRTKIKGKHYIGEELGRLTITSMLDAPSPARSWL